MSAAPSIPDITVMGRKYLRLVPIFAVSMCSKAGLQNYLLDHLVDLDEQFSRNGNAEFPCGFRIDGELEILGKLNC
jgi:hypothetical protein